MILKAFSLYDTKSAIFHTPFFLAHTGQAIRACLDLAGDSSTTIGRYPDDFQLYELGTWDDQTAVYSPIAPVSHGPIGGMLVRKPRVVDLSEALAQKEM